MQLTDSQDRVQAAGPTDASGLAPAPIAPAAAVPAAPPSPGAPPPLTTIEKTRRLKFALLGDASNAIYLNLATAGSVLLLFMDKLGLDKAQMGVLLAALGFGPLIAPITSQIGARVGFKRVALTFTVLRVALLAGMIAAPWIAARYGSTAAFAYVAAVLVGFSLCRSTADSQGGPWSMEFVPPTIRGRYTAVQMVLAMLCGATAILAVARLLGPTAPVGTFQLFFLVATFFGLVPALAYAAVPGGGPQPGSPIGLGGILAPLRDRAYRRHLIGHMTVNLGWFATVPFVPLYMKEYVGLAPGQIVTLDAAAMLGSLCSSFLWGWAADRYGGKPVMVSLLAMHVIYPIGMLFMPKHDPWSYYLAAGLVFFHGFVGIGWVIGFFRYFFNNLIPPGPQRTSYVALNTAMGGLMVGSGPLWAGWVLERLSGLTGTLGPIDLNPHVPFFLGLIVCVVIATWLMAGLPQGGGLPTRQFAGMFLQGNLITNLPNMLAFRYAGREERRIEIVGKLAASRSPWSVEELVEALNDPSFGVRYEAIVSVTRTLRDPRLTDALLNVVRGADPGLQMAAVWALGRLGDARAARTLRALLDSPYRTLRAQAARALGMLNDAESCGRLLTMLGSEPDAALRVAFGSALAALGCREAVPGLLALLRDTCGAPPAPATPTIGPEGLLARQREVSLAIATLLGRDDQALRLWRRMHDLPGDTLGGTMLALKRRLAAIPATGVEATSLGGDVERCAYALAAENLEGGCTLLLRVLGSIRLDAYTAEARRVLDACTDVLTRDGPTRREYLFLAVHALHVGQPPAADA